MSNGTKTIMLESPGTLCEHLTTDDFFQLKGIKIIGNINAKDVVVLQKIGTNLQQYVGGGYDNEDPYGYYEGSLDRKSVV